MIEALLRELIPEGREQALMEARLRDVEIGAEAQRFLESQIVKDFFTKLDRKLVDELVRLGPGSDQDMGRLRLAVAVQTTRQLHQMLEQAAQEGRVAAKELDSLRKGPRRAGL